MNTRLDTFVTDIERAIADGSNEARILDAACCAMRRLVACDDWLPSEAARPHPQHYQQHLLHLDSRRRFSVVSFVWGPGQKTPIHDHTTWGVIGMLRGSETSQSYEHAEDGSLRAAGPPESLRPGDVATVSPRIGDIHKVCNAHDDQVSISVHVYGKDIGTTRRHVFDPGSGAPKAFVSGYSQASGTPA